MILYEYPFNERVRAYLRLEYLFDRLAFFAAEGDARLHQVAVISLFDILDVCERTDMKGAVLQDLERQRLNLAALREHPDVDPAALDAMLREIERVFTALSVAGKTGQSLRENEWLSSLRGRLAMPSGATQVDMPSYYAWQTKAESLRLADLHNWMQPFQPLQEGLALALRLLRESGRRGEAVAEQGAYQQMLNGKPHQLLRVWVDPGSACFPEISANKYMVWIRFSSQDGDLKSQQVARDVSFKMSLCAA